MNRTSDKIHGLFFPGGILMALLSIAACTTTHMPRLQKKTMYATSRKGYPVAEKNDFLIIETEWGRFGFTTCYDMCFAQLYQEYALIHKVNAIIQLASWRATGTGISRKRNYKLICDGEPCDRVYKDYWGFQWDTMISDRAATNQIWMVGANAVGHQKRGDYQFWGGSGLWAPSGIKMVEASHDAEELIIIRNVPIKQQFDKEQDSFDFRHDFDRIYAPVPVGSGCTFKYCGSFIRWKKRRTVLISTPESLAYSLRSSIKHMQS